MCGAIGIADAANSGEIGLALHVVSARHDLARHRIEHRAHADAIAGSEQVARRRDVDAQPPRLVAGIEPRQRIGSDDHPPPSVERVDINDPPGKRDRPEAPLQHRRLALPSGLADQGKAGAEQGQRQRRLARQRAPVQGKSQAAGHDRSAEAEPQRRLDRQREINADPGAEKDRQPQAGVARPRSHRLRRRLGTAACPSPAPRQARRPRSPHPPSPPRRSREAKLTGPPVKKPSTWS